ncbi:hypothetical protein A3H04_02935 [Candidatus Giovannonibacteria bacterium RIFCSPLOWO2_12_FULL_43_11c]|nr:MAG: hypothetical protein A3H04_02935 [Candidatus Giovannonibacteria bacterium RIFCSPLOWO2_12_FULL_43_11c]HLD79492.1 response regulator [Candidatus Nanoarchaeia archaeon]
MKKKIKVLIVDDDVSICNALRRPLTRTGFLVDTLLGPENVLASHEKATYDIMFIDTEMPHPVGYEACAQVRQKDLSVVIIGMSSERIFQPQWIEAGANEFYHKQMSTLRSDVEDLIQQYFTIA